MEKEEFFMKLSEKASKIEIKIEKEALERFYQYMNLLIEWNEKMNLTAITEPNDIILKHFVDSITINPYIKEGDKVIDIGTGAGFPGIPLKILNTQNQFVLMDSLNKRINFLKEVCQKNMLENIDCIHGRAEELAMQNQYREQFDIATSRAVAKLNVLLEYMLPFVKVGGICICMKSSEIEEEIKEGENAIRILGGKIEKVEKIILPDSDISRSNIIIKKVAQTPKKYPRKAGIPTKQPII